MGFISNQKNNKVDSDKRSFKTKDPTTNESFPKHIPDFPLEVRAFPPKI